MKTNTPIFSLIVVGCSTGGLQALRVLLGGLPRGLPLPVAIVQHRATGPASGLTKMLGAASPLPVCEPCDKQKLQPGCVYLAPAGYHLLVEADHFALSTGSPVANARPSVDVLFESAADAYGPRVIAVVLTGANSDGARGAARVKACGGHVIVEDPATAEARSMPDAALAATSTDQVLPLARIAACLSNLCPVTVPLKP